ncbi:fibronectin type III domain-containing protein [Pimelobacter simplex]|uniref:fibronectin type III domain-containing protein n=1 Tax=Nocardioides simplex TaxID=2045 RepID=UPI003AAEA010
MNPTCSRSRTHTAVVVLATIATAVALLGALPTPAAEAARAAAPGKAKHVRLVQPTVSGDRAGLTVKWNRAKRARTYRVRWSTSSTMAGAQATSTRGRSVVLRNLAQGVTYCAQVRAKAGKQKGPWSRPVCRTTPRLDPVGAPWVSGQVVQGTAPSTVAVTFSWPRVAGASGYQVDYAPGTGSVQSNRKKKTVKADISGSRTVRGLTPGGTYCFQVRALSKWGTGLRSTTGCRLLTRAERTVPPRAFALDFATWNVCSTMCSKPSWAKRQVAVRDRIQRMNADVVAVQEAIAATPYLTANLGGYTRGCQVGDGTTAQGNTVGRQALYVRTSTYNVVAGTNQGIIFSQVGDVYPSHGACWVELQNKATGQHVVVASVHLVHPIGAKYDKGRDRQTLQLLTAIAQRYAGKPMPPVALAGDFNSHRQRAYDGPRVRLEANGYRDSFDVAARFLTPSYRNSAHGWATTPLVTPRTGNHLDRVFTSAGIHAASWRIDEPMTADGRYYAGLLSDHSPVITSLRIPY